MRNHAWQDWELELLRNEYAAVGPRGLANRLPYRSLKAIRTRANELGLQYKVHQSTRNEPDIEWDTAPTSIEEIWERARILREAREECDELKWYAPVCKVSAFGR